MRTSAEVTPVDRYELHGLLGQGGMALVYSATDRVRNQPVALKRLHPLTDPVKRRRNVELFELEFHTLAQLAHPRVVEVYDFGISPQGAYYTMELLDGGDLHQLAPVPWRTACAIARDVCSALSLLHSRRLVHRDISPRNVRRTQSGSVKLIDFGALSSMGTNKLLVGTAPCCAPECVQAQALDGRADLYALGGTLYYALVGQHAYPARNFVGLQEAWRQGFLPPSASVPDIPPALDALILDLLRLEPDARPPSAAEVLQRLAAIDGESANELQAAAAYLATPSLIGREQDLARVQRRFDRLKAGRGRSIVFEGPAGVGRSRLLDACLLDATLRGLLCVRADADDALGGEYAVVRALSRQLLSLVPQLAEECARPHAAALAHLLPELSRAPAAEHDEASLRPRLPLAVREWWKALAARRPLVLAVDDFPRIDESSAALLAVLAGEAAEHPLCLLTSAERGAAATSPAAQKLLLDASSCVPLENLSPEQSEQLLAALFGHVPRLSLLAQRVQPLCAGNPRDLLHLAQHLIDRRLLRYDSGAWTLPEALERAPLPSSMAATLEARIAGLRDSARQLADALALCPDQTFALGECALLNGSRDPSELAADLDALTHVQLSKRHADGFGLAHTSWLPLLAATLSEPRARLLQGRLGEVLLARGDVFRAMRHLLRAGQESRALDVAVPWLEDQLELTRARDMITAPGFRSPADGWNETYHEALRACDRLGRPARHKYLLLNRMTTISAMYGMQDREPMLELLSLLERASGLRDYAELASLPEAERRSAAMQRAQARYQSTSEHERVIAPALAIRELARACSNASSMIAIGLDLQWLRSMPELAPLAPLSPALGVINSLMAGMHARLSGRTAQAREIYGQIIERLAEADHAGFDAVRSEYVGLGVMNVLGMLEAASGMPHCLHWAERVERHFVYEVNALVIRRLFALFQGDTPVADGYKGQIEALRVQTSSRQIQEGVHLLWEVDAHAWSEDLTRLRHSIEDLTPLAKRYAGWAPVVRYALAEHHRIRHSSKTALAEIETGLLLAQAGEHPIWASMAQSHLRILLDLGQPMAALDKADEYVAAATAALGGVPPMLALVRALTYAVAGRVEALELAAGVLVRLEQQGVTGLLVGCAHDLYARSAQALGDMATFQRELELCREIYAAHKSPALSAKYQRLRQLRKATGGARSGGASDSPDTSVASRIGVALEACRDKAQRAKLALTFLCRQSGASSGLMFALGSHGPECIGSVGETALPEELLERVQMYWMEETRAINTTNTDSEDLAGDEWRDSQGRVYRPILLNHTADGRLAVTGVAVLCVPAHAKFTYPAETAAEISRYAADVGDSSLVVVLD